MSIPRTRFTEYAVIIRPAGGNTECVASIEWATDHGDLISEGGVLCSGIPVSLWELAALVARDLSENDHDRDAILTAWGLSPYATTGTMSASGPDDHSRTRENGQPSGHPTDQAAGEPATPSGDA